MALIKSNNIAILLATYQGELFIKEQIESLLQQTYDNWTLFIHDDGSKDNTMKIVESFSIRFPNKIVILDGLPTGGAKNNFLYLMRRIDAQYYMCCDQDDVWLPTKIEITFKAIKELENKRINTPCLVHTDLSVVNENLDMVAEKMSVFQNLECKHTKLNRILLQNVVTGCTMMFNKKLRDMAIQYKDERNIIMHDWWLAIIASQFGEIKYIDKATILYRQHGNNSVGAINSKNMSYLFNKVKRINEIKNAINKTQLQAKEMVDTFNLESSSIPAKLSICLDVSKLKRLAIYWKYGFRKTGIIRNIGLIIWG